MSLDSLYQQTILDHAKALHGRGLTKTATATSYQKNPTCGDDVHLEVDIGEDGLLRGVHWDGQGCSISRASLSMMTDLVTGATRPEIDAAANAFRELMDSRGAPATPEQEELLGDAVALAGTSKFPARIKCALLGWMALREALAKADVYGGPAESHLSNLTAHEGETR